MVSGAVDQKFVRFNGNFLWNQILFPSFGNGVQETFANFELSRIKLSRRSNSSIVLSFLCRNISKRRVCGGSLPLFHMFLGYVLQFDLFSKDGYLESFKTCPPHIVACDLVKFTKVVLDGFGFLTVLVVSGTNLVVFRKLNTINALFFELEFQ